MDIEALYREHSEKIRIFLLSKEKDPALINDIVQDAFLKLYSYLSVGKEVRNPKSWLYKVANNLLMDHYRNEKKIEDSSYKMASDNDSVDFHGPEDCLLGIIANLPYKYKKAVYLTDIKGLRQVDAAKQLQLSLPTFKSHVQRGRRLVAQGYVDCCDYEINDKGHLEGEAKDWRECKVCNEGEVK